MKSWLAFIAGFGFGIIAGGFWILVETNPK
jgi:hypothetical protein